MKKIILDLNTSMTKNELHSYLKEKFDFPEYYGKNLDALYDCLTEICEPTAIGLFITNDFTDEIDAIPADNESPDSENCGIELSQQESYLRKLVKTFEDAERCNENLAVIISR